MLGHCWVGCRLACFCFLNRDYRGFIDFQDYIPAFAERSCATVAPFHHVIASSYSDGELLSVAFPRAVDTGSSPV